VVSARLRRLACAAAVIAGCAANAVTLRSNHYQVLVPAGWQVVEEGGAPEIPTLIRVPAAENRGQPLELRIYAWPVQGPLADPTSDAFQRLASAGVLGLAAARADDEDPCPGRRGELVVLGRPARAMHVRNSAGQHIVITGGHQHGSLVGVVAVAGPAGCTSTDGTDGALTRLAAGLVGQPDTTRPWMPPTLVGPQGVPMPPPDPNAPTP
jgi:hypothetical protein